MSATPKLPPVPLAEAEMALPAEPGRANKLPASEPAVTPPPSSPSTASDDSSGVDHFEFHDTDSSASSSSTGASTPVTTPSSVASGAELGVDAAGPASPWLQVQAKTAEGLSPHFDYELPVPGLGKVPAHLELAHLAGNEVDFRAGAVAHPPEPFALLPGETVADYAHFVGQALKQRLRQAPREAFALRLATPVQARLALGEAERPARPGEGRAGMLASVAAAGSDWARAFAQGGLRAVDDLLHDSQLRFSHVARAGDAPLVLDGISLGEREAKSAEEQGVAAVHQGAAMATQASFDPWWARLSRHSGKLLSHGLIQLGTAFLPAWLRDNLPLVEQQVLGAYDRALHSAGKAKPQKRPSGKTSSDALRRLYGLGTTLQSVERATLDLEQLVPPLLVQGRDGRTLVRIAPAPSPVSFSGHLADGDDALRAQLEGGVTVSQPFGAAEPVTAWARARGQAAARGLATDRALLRSNDPHHAARMEVDLNLAHGHAPLAHWRGTAALDHAHLELGQMLKWSPETVAAVVTSWLPAVMDVSPASAFSPALKQVLKTVGLSSLASGPQEAVAKLAGAFAAAEAKATGIPANAVDVALDHKGAAAGTDAALSSLFAGLGLLRGSHLGAMAKDVAGDSDVHLRLALRELDVSLADTPALASLPLRSHLHLQVKHAGQFSVRHAPAAQEQTAAPRPTAASVAARLGAWLLAPVRWLAGAAGTAAAAIWHAIRRPFSSPAAEGPRAADIRLVPTLKVPFGRAWFGEHLSLGWLAQVRLRGEGAQVDDEGRLKLAGEVRLFGLPVYRLHHRTITTLPLGSRAAAGRPARAKPRAAKHEAAAADPLATVPAWLRFADQLFDGVSLSVSPRAESARTLSTAAAAHAPAGLFVSRERAPMTFDVFRSVDGPGWGWQAEGLDLGARRDGARLEASASAYGRFVPEAAGEAARLSGRVDGKLRLFGADSALLPMVRGHFGASLSERGGQPEAAIDWSWGKSTRAKEAHEELLRAMGPSARWAALWPQHLSVRAGRS